MAGPPTPILEKIRLKKNNNSEIAFDGPNFDYSQTSFTIDPC